MRNQSRSETAPGGVKETVDARVYVGIHFRTSDEVAREQGQRIAKWAFKHFLRPLK